MKRKDNVQKIKHLMVMNPGGPLTQVFIIEAVRHYAGQVLAEGEPEENAASLINGRAWYATAAMVADELRRLEAAQ